MKKVEDLGPFFASYPKYREWATKELVDRRVDLWHWFARPDSYGVYGKLPEWLQSPVPSNQKLWFFVRDLIWWHSYRAAELARQDLPAALRIARDIPLCERSIRTRTMAGIARNAPPEFRKDLFREAYQTAWSANEDFRRVFDSGLVMEAELQAGMSLEIHQVERSLQEAMRIDHTLNRAVAVAGLWQTIFSVGPVFRAKVQKVALKTALEA